MAVRSRPMHRWQPRHRLHLGCHLLLLLSVHCAAAKSISGYPCTEVVSSGFEPASSLPASTDTVRIWFSGADRSFPAPANNWSNSGVAVYYEEGPGHEAQATIAQESAPDGARNHVLQYAMRGPNVASEDKGRIQASAQLNQGSGVAFRSSVQVRLENGFDLLSQSAGYSTWLTWGEFWCGVPRSSNGAYRVTLNIKKVAGVGEPLKWCAHGQDGPGTWTTHWEHCDETTPVWVHEWLRLDMVGVAGKGADSGHFAVNLTRMATGESYSILNVAGATCHPTKYRGQGWEALQPMKLYTCNSCNHGALGKALALGADRLQMSWDNFSLSVCGDTHYAPGTAGAGGGGAPWGILVGLAIVGAVLVAVVLAWCWRRSHRPTGGKQCDAELMEVTA